MPTTPEFDFPYPAPTDAPDVPYYMQQLAEAVENLLANKPVCVIRAGAAQNLPNNIVTSIGFDTGATLIDTDGMSDLPNNAIVIQTAGTYRLSAQMNFASNATGYRVVQIRVNGTTVAQDYRPPVNGAVTACAFASEPLALAANDIVSVVALQNSGGVLATSNPNFVYPRLSAEWVIP